MHQLLALQIKKHLSSDKGLTPELQGLLAEVDRHYQETEQVRRKLDLSLNFQKKELADAMLQASRDYALLRGVMDIIPDVLFFKSADGSYLGFNKVYEKVLIRPASQMLGDRPAVRVLPAYCQPGDRRGSQGRSPGPLASP